MSLAASLRGSARRHRSSSGWPAALLAGLLLAPQVSEGSKPRLRLERIDTSRCPGERLVEVCLAEVELEGVLSRRPRSTYRLVVDGKPLDHPPVHVTTFAKSGRPLHLSLVVEATPGYESHLERIKAALRELVRSVPKAARVSVVAYDWQVRRLLTRGTARQATSVIDTLTVGSAEAEPALDDALALALRGLGPRSTSVRRLLVPISDGINRNPRWDVFRGLGSRARTLGVTIHPIAFSPLDERGPLLNLGELAKRTGGTLRWARQPTDIGREILNLAQEINAQQVQTFRLPAGCSRPHSIQVARGGLVSNTIQTPALREARAAGGKNPLRVLLFVGLLLLALALLIGLVVFLLRPLRDGRAPRR